MLNTKVCDYESVKTFGGLESPIKVCEKPEILFARLDQAEVFAKIDANKQVVEKPKEIENEITIEDFAKVELTVGKILHCEKHPNADRLLVSKIDIGNGDVRTIVSGIASCYKPEDLIGKKVVVVSNLKAAKLKGIESQGMILAGKDGKLIEVLNVDKLPEGTKIS